MQAKDRELVMVQQQLRQQVSGACVYTLVSTCVLAYTDVCMCALHRERLSGEGDT